MTATPTRKDPLVHIRRASCSTAYCGDTVSFALSPLMYPESNCYRCLRGYSEEMQKESDRLQEKATMLRFAAEARGIWTDPA